MAQIGEPVKTYDIPDPEEIPDEVPQESPSEPAVEPHHDPVPA